MPRKFGSQSRTIPITLFSVGPARESCFGRAVDRVRVRDLRKINLSPLGFAINCNELNLVHGGLLSPDGLDNHQFDAHRVRSGGGVHLKIPIDLI
jgi:hypothetical protein